MNMEYIDYLKLADKIEEMLPQEQYTGYAIISMVIDAYSHKMGIATRTAWNMMYNTAMSVCDELGEYGG